MERTPSADEVAVCALYTQLMDAWNAGSGDAMAALYTADGDLIGFDGTHFIGREEIATFHQRLFDTVMQGSRLVGDVRDVRFLCPEVAVLHATGQTIMPGQTAPTQERDSIQTIVAVKEDGVWRIAAFQNTRIQSWQGQTGPHELLGQLEEIRKRRAA
ncbi:MAG: SgcJ/EcaC family oxidoreductase [Armatimonadota bacterium]